MADVYSQSRSDDPSQDAFSVPTQRHRVLTEQFAQAFEENPIKATQRWLELREDDRTGPKLDAESARSRLRDAGMENDLTVSDAGITEAALLTLMDRKRVEKRRQEVFARAEGGFTENAQRFGLAFATTLADPLSAGLNFVPIVGQVRYARWLAQSRSLAGRLATRVKAGAIEGAAGAAIAEVPIYAMRTQEQADYDMADSLLNIAFGGVIGAGLHTTVGTAAELISKRLPQRTPVQRVEPTVEPARIAEPLPADVQRAIFDWPRTVDELPPEVQQAALRAAVGQGIEGRDIDVEPVVASAVIPGRPIVSNWDSTDFLSGSDARYVTRHVSDYNTVIAASSKRSEKIGSVTINGEELGLYRDLFAGHPDEREIYAARPATNDFSKKLGDDLEKVATIKLADDRTLEHVVVASGYRRSGLATRLAEEAQKRLGAKVLEARDRSHNGAAFMESLRQRTLRTQTDPELQAATEAADQSLSRDFEPTTEASLKAAEDEAALAEADAKALAERLGVKFSPDDELAEGLEKAERWARVAELATVCLVRGG